MIESISSSSSTSASAAMKKSMGMNKDDFLTLFVTQLKNQDPLKPMDGNEFLAQLAQLTQVEQAYNTNTNLQNILSALNNSSSLSVASFVGQQATVLGNQVGVTAGETTQLGFSLAKAAASVVVEVRDASGNLVRTITQGTTASGESLVAWDGRDDSGNQLSSGNYSFSVTGYDSAGAAFSGTTKVRGTVTGVSFASDTPTLSIAGKSYSLDKIISIGG
jgi:flagellar basal-body rod modification protein FlgD